MLRLCVILFAVLTATAVYGHDFTLDGVRVDHPWSRATPPGAKVAAGYMAITNNTGADVTLTGGEAAFADVELHMMEVRDGMMRMAEVPGGITIPAGETVTLEPGGLHVMFMNLGEPLVASEFRTVTLEFGGLGTLDVIFLVAPMGAVGHPPTKDD